MNVRLGNIAVIAIAAVGMAISAWSASLPERVQICDLLADPVRYAGRRIEVIGHTATDMHMLGVTGFCSKPQRADTIWFREPFELPENVPITAGYSHVGMSLPMWQVSGDVVTVAMPSPPDMPSYSLLVMMDNIKISSWWWLNFDASTKRTSEGPHPAYGR